MPTCLQGHESPADTQYCTTCGSPMQESVATSTPLVFEPTAPAPPPPPAPTGPAESTPLLSTPTATTTAAPVAPPVTPPAGPASHGPAAPAAPAWGRPPAGAASPVPGPLGTPPVAPGFNPVAAGSAQRYGFQLRRLTLIDQITAGAALLLFISLWLPWFGASSGGFSYSLGGINAHSYLSFAVLTSIVLIAYLAARAGWDRLPIRLPIAHAPLLLVVGLVQLLIVVIAFLSTPSGLSHDAGSWIALIAALGASLPIAIPAIQATQHR